MLALSTPSVTTTSTFFSFAPFFSHVDGLVDGVAHGRAAARIDARQRLLHFVDIAGEILAVRVVEIGIVVEIHDEDFVVGVGILHQREGRGFHAGALGPHAAAVVDNQPHGDRDIFPLEKQDVLLDVVLR